MILDSQFTSKFDFFTVMLMIREEVSDIVDQDLATIDESQVGGRGVKNQDECDVRTSCHSCFSPSVIG